jgi:long-subunit fatty acid transport protein
MHGCFRIGLIAVMVVMMGIGVSVELVIAGTIFQQVGVASPPVPVGSGARAMGMAGAFISVCDDATAASWNPAGLIQLERPELSIVGAHDARQSRYSSDSHPEIDGDHYDAVTSLNYLSATFPLHWHRNMVVSINYQRLYDFERSFSHDFLIRSTGLELTRAIEFEQDGELAAVGLAGAVQITPMISLGLTLNIWTDELGYDNGWRSTYRALTNGTQAGIPVSDETVIEEQYTKFRGINFNLGFLWETGRLGTIGAVIKTPFKATLVHRYAYVSSSQNTPLRQVEAVNLYMPISYGLGWSRRFADQWTISGDIYRTHWQDYRMTDRQGNAFSPIDGRLASQSNIDPTIHLRLGCEYVFLFPDTALAVPVRAGLFYDPEPSEDGNRDFYGFALGAGLTRQRFSLDLAYQLRWGANIDTANLIATTKADVIQHNVTASLIWYF